MSTEPEPPLHHRPYLVTWWLHRRERKRVIEWVRDEWIYADRKYGDAALSGHDESMRTEGLDRDGFWAGHMMSYMGRAQTLGLDTPQGRQVLMKMCTTVLDMAASMSRVYGDPPKPGYPSGEIHE